MSRPKTQARSAVLAALGKAFALVAAAAPCAAWAANEGATASDWPCVQRRTGTISAGALWSGPDLAAVGPWDKDFQAAALAQKLASRRTAVEDIDPMLDDFAQKAGAEKSVRLTRVFAGVLEIINTERDRVLSGIARYAHGQQKLAERVREESDAVADAQDSPDAAQGAAATETASALKWDKRIFEERSRSLTYVCEVPVLLERRAFDIARRIQQHL